MFYTKLMLFFPIVLNTTAMVCILKALFLNKNIFKSIILLVFYTSIYCLWKNSKVKTLRGVCIGILYYGIVII